MSWPSKSRAAARESFHWSQIEAVVLRHGRGTGGVSSIFILASLPFLIQRTAVLLGSLIFCAQRSSTGLSVELGVADGARTRDFQSHNLVL